MVTCGRWARTARLDAVLVGVPPVPSMTTPRGRTAPWRLPRPADGWTRRRRSSCKAGASRAAVPRMVAMSNRTRVVVENDGRRPSCRGEHRRPLRGDVHERRGGEPDPRRRPRPDRTSSTVARRTRQRRRRRCRPDARARPWVGRSSRRCRRGTGRRRRMRGRGRRPGWRSRRRTTPPGERRPAEPSSNSMSRSRSSTTSRSLSASRVGRSPRGRPSSGAGRRPRPRCSGS